MKQRTAEAGMSVLAGILAMICLIMFMDAAEASNKKPPEPIKVDIDVTAGAEANSAAQASSEAHSDATASSESSASNEGNTLTAEGDTTTIEGDRTENNSSNVVLVPSNNTVDCHKVYGLAFGKDGTSGGVGWPYRDKACDYEQAGAAAAATGDHDTAWFWRCHKKNLYKPFLNRREGVSRDVEKQDAINACHSKMAGENANVRMIQMLKDEVSAANARADLAKEHEKVCKESKQRCQDRLYGGK